MDGPYYIIYNILLISVAVSDYTCYCEHFWVMCVWEFSYGCVAQPGEWLVCRTSNGTNWECVCDFYLRYSL
jgi:hypothetical protein